MMDLLFSDDARRDPYPLYARLRAASPVLRAPGADIWFLLDHATVKRAMDDPATFSSRAAPPGGQPFDWLIFSDPPRHTLLRAIVQRAFVPRSIAGLEPRIRALSGELLDACVTRGTMDLVDDYAALLPTLVIAELFGFPATDRGRLIAWSQAIMNLSHAIAGGEAGLRAGKAFVTARDEIGAWLPGLLQMRRAEPLDDLLTRLVAAEVDGERLDDAEITGFFLLLLSAATETTTNLISNAVLCLQAHPEQRARLVASPDLLPAAIEEVVRYRAPAQFMFRATTCDVTLLGQVIPAGKLVLLGIGSANRDPKQFADADVFDIARSPNPHLGFGHGIHFCLGAALARLEAKVALEHILERVPDLALAGDTPWEPRSAVHVHGPAHLPVRFTASTPPAPAPSRG
jgi:cytochrome P450